MKRVLATILALILLVAATMDAVHAVPRGHDIAAHGMPAEDDATEMVCCDGLSGRTAACLGDIFTEMARAAPPGAESSPAWLAPGNAAASVGHDPETPTGPPRG